MRVDSAREKLRGYIKRTMDNKAFDKLYYQAIDIVRFKNNVNSLSEIPWGCGYTQALNVLRDLISLYNEDNP